MAEIIHIYTSITGDYDDLIQPVLPAEGFDFTCFVRRGSGLPDKIGAWSVVEIPSDLEDPVLLSRYPKMNPQSVFADGSDWSLWIDGNIGIRGYGFYEICRKMQEAGVKYAGIRHVDNDCAYQEAERCLKDRRESLYNLFRTVRLLRRAGYPEHSGMMENNVIFRKHSDPDVIGFDRIWWEYFLKYAHRDQILHGFCMKKVPDLKVELLLPEGVCARNHPDLAYVKHPSKRLTWLQRKLKYGLHKPERWILHSYIRLTRKK